MTSPIRSSTLFALTAVAVLAACGERPPIDSVQRGYRGLGMVELFNPRLVSEHADANQAPAPIPPIPGGGPKASAVFKNVQVLGDLEVGEFTRTMLALTAWVSPQQGCNYCHVEGDLASDNVFTKVVSRRMIEMTRAINTSYANHVAQTGVTCYTCHRGEPVPKNLYFADPGPAGAMGMTAGRAGQNAPAATVGYASLPFDPFTPFVTEGRDVRVISGTALPTGNRSSIKQTEWTYGLMMHFSQALGVNCTYCHNTRSFADWDASTPQRTTSWYGIRMIRDLNRDYLAPLHPVFPADRLGPTGDVPKINCGTCHNGTYKPLYGVSMLKDYPTLAAKGATSAPAVVPANPPGTAPVELTPKPAPTAAAGSNAAIVYFPLNSATPPTDAAATLNALVNVMKANPATSASISGFHSASGDAAKNHELAKGRAMAVQTAMVNAGIGASRLNLDKPVQESASTSGEDQRARRVEVTLR